MVREIRPGHDAPVVVDTGGGARSEAASLLIAAVIVLLLGLLATLLPARERTRPVPAPTAAASSVPGGATPAPLPAEASDPR